MAAIQLALIATFALPAFPAWALEGLFDAPGCAEELRTIEASRGNEYRRRAKDKNLNLAETVEYVARNVRRRYLLERSARITNDLQIGEFVLRQLQESPEWSRDEAARAVAAQRLSGGIHAISGIEAPLTLAILSTPPRNADDLARAKNLLGLAAAAALYHVETAAVFAQRLPLDHPLSELDVEAVRRAVLRASFQPKMVHLETAYGALAHVHAPSRAERMGLIDSTFVPAAVRAHLSAHLDFDLRYDVLPHTFHGKFALEVKRYFDRGAPDQSILETVIGP